MSMYKILNSRQVVENYLQGEPVFTLCEDGSVEHQYMTFREIAFANRENKLFVSNESYAGEELVESLFVFFYKDRYRIELDEYSCGGWNYSWYDARVSQTDEFDGGVYDDEGCSVLEVLREILKDIEEREERMQKQNASIRHA